MKALSMGICISWRLGPVPRGLGHLVGKKRDLLSARRSGPAIAGSRFPEHRFICTLLVRQSLAEDASRLTRNTMMPAKIAAVKTSASKMNQNRNQAAVSEGVKITGQPIAHRSLAIRAARKAVRSQTSCACRTACRPHNPILRKKRS